MPSSTLLVICMFLPAMEVCGKPMYPVEFPPVWSPYVVAALVFAAVLIRPWRLYPLALAIRLVFGITAALFSLSAIGENAPDPLVLVPVMILGLSLALVVVPARTHELMIARLGVVAGIASTVWFGALSSDPDAMYGVYVSVVAASALALGSAWWWLEAHADSR